MQLSGRCALITGAGSGIGREMAILAVARGMEVALVGRTEASLRNTRTMLCEPARGHVLVADITDREGRLRLRKETGALFGRLDVLINNAGVQTVGPLGQLDDRDLEAVILTNLISPIALVREMLDLLQVAAPSRIVNVGSMFGEIGFPMYSVYSASKFGLRGFSDALRREMKDFQVGVTYTAPRATRTPATDRTAHMSEAFKMVLDEPEDVARRILDAVERDARSVYPRGAERLFIWLQRLFPRAVDAAVVKQLRSAGLHGVTNA